MTRTHRTDAGDGPARAAGPVPAGRPTRRRRTGRPVTAAAPYLVVAVAVTTAEYVSELSKTSRGTYTDTFSPLLLTQLLTLPLSAAHGAWSGYPAQFSPAAYRQAVHAALVPTAVNILATAALIAGTGLLWTRLRTRAHR